MKTLIVCVSLACVTFVCCKSVERERPVVETDKGDVIGTVETSVKGKEYYSFKAIPYAKVPVGKLRFQPPEEPQPWLQPIDASKEASKCTQLQVLEGVHVVGSEDCLYLNVFSSRLSTDTLQPVMVWIHGGSYNRGSGNTTAVDGPDFIVDKDVVLVNLNYRLGPFGFLNLPSLNISGNAGLKDQLAVLKWVNRNIRNFGGDPGKVTLVGWSAGASSVHHHLQAKASQGLFHGAILMSGSVLNAWAFTDYATYWSERLCESLNISMTDETELQNFSNEMITLFDIEFLEEQYDDRVNYVYSRGNQRPFVPSAEKGENAFLDKPPMEQILENGFIAKVPVIIGLTSYEGLNTYEMYKSIAAYYFHQPENYKSAIRAKYMSFDMDTKKHSEDEISQMILDRYVTNSSVPIGDILMTIDSDFAMNYGVQKTVKMYMKLAEQAESNDHINNLYFYKFSFDGDFAYYKQKLKVNSSIHGVCHGDDTGYLFKFKKYEKLYNVPSQSVLMLERMVTMWTNFVKTGDPTPSVSKLIPIKWPPVTSKIPYYLDINEDLTVMTSIDEDVYEFWDQFY